MFVDSPSLPLGFNRNSIQVNPNDYSSIIAFALCSNLYIEGLMKINYMDLNNKMTACHSGNNIERTSSMPDGDFIVQKNDKLKLSEKNDILNKETSNHDIENELLGIDNVTFSI